MEKREKKKGGEGTPSLITALRVILGLRPVIGLGLGLKLLGVRTGISGKVFRLSKVLEYRVEKRSITTATTTLS